MTDAKPFTTEEIELQITRVDHDCERKDCYFQRQAHEHARRFLATIRERDARIEELTHCPRCHELIHDGDSITREAGRYGHIVCAVSRGRNDTHADR